MPRCLSVSIWAVSHETLRLFISPLQISTSNIEKYLFSLSHYICHHIFERVIRSLLIFIIAVNDDDAHWCCTHCLMLCLSLHISFLFHLRWHGADIITELLSFITASFTYFSHIFRRFLYCFNAYHIIIAPSIGLLMHYYHAASVITAIPLPYQYSHHAYYAITASHYLPSLYAFAAWKFEFCA